MPIYKDEIDRKPLNNTNNLIKKHLIATKIILKTNFDTYRKRRN